MENLQSFFFSKAHCPKTRTFPKYVRGNRNKMKTHNDQLLVLFSKPEVVPGCLLDKVQESCVFSYTRICFCSKRAPLPQTWWRIYPPGIRCGYKRSFLEMKKGEREERVGVGLRPVILSLTSSTLLFQPLSQLFLNMKLF